MSNDSGIGGIGTAAIIGCGRGGKPADGKVGWGIAHAHATAYRQAFPEVALYAVDPSAENLADFARKHGIASERCFASTEALYAAVKPDAVSVCTWPILHARQTIEAMRKGVRAVVVEKPVAMDGFELQEIRDVARHTKVRVAVAHQRRYEPWYVEAKRLVAQGVLGDRVVFEGRVGDDWDILSWSVHWFDMANFILGGTPTSVLAGVEHRGERRYGHAVERASVILAEYGPGRQGVFITGPAALPFFGVTLRGEKGMMHVDRTIKLWTTEGYREIVPEKMDFARAYVELLRDLWASVTSGQRSRCDIEECGAATAMAFAAHESARTMRRVALPLETWYAPLEVEQHPASPRAASAAGQGKWRVAVLADGHHVWEGVRMEGRAGLQDALTGLGHEVTTIEAKGWEPADGALDGYEVLVIYHTQRQSSPTVRAVVGRWIESDRPVVVSHCGIGAYADWPEYRRWIGRYWVWGGESLPPSGHPHVPCRVRVDDPERFDVPWREAWLPTDEVYYGLGEAAKVRPLATAITDGFEQTYAWQTVDRPNIVTFLPGHRADMFRLPVIREGLSASLRLACGHGGV